MNTRHLHPAQIIDHGRGERRADGGHGVKRNRRRQKHVGAKSLRQRTVAECSRQLEEAGRA